MIFYRVIAYRYDLQGNLTMEGLQWKVEYIDGDLSGQRWLWDNGIGGDGG